MCSARCPSAKMMHATAVAYADTVVEVVSTFSSASSATYGTVLRMSRRPHTLATTSRLSLPPKLQAQSLLPRGERVGGAPLLLLLRLFPLPLLLHPLPHRLRPHSLLHARQALATPPPETRHLLQRLTQSLRLPQPPRWTIRRSAVSSSDTHMITPWMSYSYFGTLLTRSALPWRFPKLRSLPTPMLLTPAFAASLKSYLVTTSTLTLRAPPPVGFPR